MGAGLALDSRDVKARSAEVHTGPIEMMDPQAPALSPGRSAPGTAKKSRRGGRRVSAVRGLIALGLIALTAWNVTRSDSLTEAVVAEERGDFVQAVRHALDHLDRRPWSRDAARVAARGLSRLAFVDAAKPYFDQGEPLGRDDLLIRAFALLRADRRAESTRLYEEILARWPDDPTALRQLAVVRMIESNLPEAIHLAERLSGVPGHEVVGATMVGSYQHNRQEYEQAVAAFDRVLELDPELRRMPLPKPTFWRYYAVNLLSIGRTDAVRRALGRALHSSGPAEVQNDARLWTMLGHAYHLEGDFASAEATFLWASRLDPKDFDTWNSLGQVLLAQNRPEDALDPLNRALAVEPDSWSAVYSLILANARLGRDDEVARLRALADEIRRTRGVPTIGMGGPSTTLKTPSP